MKPWLLVLVGTGVIILLDMIWLGFLMRGFYQQIPGRGDVNVIAAVLTWIVISLGIVLFALPLAHSWQSALLWGAVFGLVVYAVYDLTNLAVLAGWPLPVVVVDVLWGGFLCGVTATVLFLLR